MMTIILSMNSRVKALYSVAGLEVLDLDTNSYRIFTDKPVDVSRYATYTEVYANHMDVVMRPNVILTEN